LGLRDKEFPGAIGFMKFGALPAPGAAPALFLYSKHCESEVLKFSTSELKPASR
jgi:hypothetical protein